MNVDLISAFEGAASGADGAGPSGSQTEFPSVLRSAVGMDSAEAGSRASAEDARQAAGDDSAPRSETATADRAATPDAADASEQQQTRAEGEAGSNREERDSDPGGAGDDADPSRNGAAASDVDADAGTGTGEREGDDATVDAAVAGGVAAALIDAAAAGRLSEATDAGSGRPTDLEAGIDAGELADRGPRRRADPEAAAQATRGGAVDEAAARAALDEASRAAGAGAAAAGADASAVVAEAGLAGSAPGAATGRAARASGGDERALSTAGESGPASDTSAAGSPEGLARSAEASAEDTSGHEQASSERNPDAARSEQALYDRAAEGAQSAGVDPGLRQAVANADEAQRAAATIPIEGAPALASPVAGAVTETTTATPGQPTPPVASDAISVQTEWLATRGGGSARLMLHPPELGELAIRVTLRGGAVEVVMVAQEAVAQAVAEEQSERLAQAFANRDLRMESFEVRRGNPEDLQDAATGRFADESGGRDERAEDENASRGGRGELGGDAAPGGGDDLGGTLPRIVSAGPEAGVDLRI